jgi:hypothetical protein
MNSLTESRREKDKKKVVEASLMKVLMKTYGREVLVSWFFKMVYDFLQFVNPQLLE